MQISSFYDGILIPYINEGKMQNIDSAYKIEQALKSKPVKIDKAVVSNSNISIAKKDNMQEIASRFRAIRKAAFYSQEEIGNIIGVSYQQVQKYEAAMDRIPAVSLYILAKYLDISVKEFFPESNVNTSNDFINNEVWVMARKLMAIKDGSVRKKISSLLTCLEGV